MSACGKNNWIIPDCELPPEGEGVLKGHESVIVVNDSDKPAKIKVTLFFVDEEPYENIEWTVEAKRVRCFRMNRPEDMSGYVTLSRPSDKDIYDITQEDLVMAALRFDPDVICVGEMRDQLFFLSYPMICCI